MNLKKNAAIYIRVSTAEQALEGYSIQSQTEKLQAYCKAMDFNVYDVYTDPGFTGANLNRPAMQKLISDVQEHFVDVVIVMKLDRLSRSQKDTLHLIEDVFLANGCEFTSVTESFDTSTPYGRAFIGILAVFAQFERERIRERVMDGKIERAKSGKIMAWGHPAIGYDYVNESYVVNEYEASMVRRIFDLCEEGLSINKIKAVIDKEYPLGTKHATKDGKIHLVTVRRILRNRVYLGIVKYAKKEYPGCHEPIISAEQFDKVQTILELKRQNSVGSRKNPFKSTHLLTGLLFCANCGARVHAQSRRHINNDRWYYVCYSVSNTSKKYRKSDSCTQKVIDGETMDNFVLNMISSLKTSKSFQLPKKDSSVPKLEYVLEQTMEKTKQKMNKLLDLYLDDKFDKAELERKNQALAKEYDDAKAQLNNIRKQKSKLTKAQATEYLNKFENVFESGSLDDRKAFLSIFIDHIELNGDNVNIILNSFSD